MLEGRSHTDAVVAALWQWVEAAMKSLPPQPAPIPEAYVRAQAALDALVAAIGADGRAA